MSLWWTIFVLIMIAGVGKKLVQVLLAGVRRRELVQEERIRRAAQQEETERRTADKRARAETGPRFPSATEQRQPKAADPKADPKAERVIVALRGLGFTDKLARPAVYEVRGDSYPEVSEEDLLKRSLAKLGPARR